MARQVMVLVLVLLAVVQAFAADAGEKSKVTAPAPAVDDAADLAEPPTGDVIGVLDAADSPSSLQVAPIGGPVPPGAFDSTPSPSAASTLEFSAVAGALTVAGFFF